MMNNVAQTLPQILEKSVDLFEKREAISFIGEPSIKYYELFLESKKVSFWLSENGIKKNDKIAIWSENSPNWVIAFWGIVSMGAINVSLLPDFSILEILNILQHSDSKILFISKRLYQKNIETLKLNYPIVILDDWEEVNTSSTILNVDEIKFAHYHPEKVTAQDVANIIYTSGTTGRSKGVMLTHGALTFEMEKVLLVQNVDEKDVFLSLLPLSHVYENVLGMLLPIRQGARIYYMKKVPTPALLIDALGKVRPTMILTVPLIIEKIYKTRILPALNKYGIMKGFIHVWPIRYILNNYAGKKLLKAFGGRLRFFGIGGAAVNPQTERFLRDSHFPYSCGFGLTETSSLIFGSKVGKVKFRSVGKPLDTLSYRIVRPTTKTKTGEVVVRWGGNMKGYYKEPELTASVLTEGNWFHTGDLAEMINGNLYLKGRSKTMILGPSGENIYPEEIESVINRMEGVVESLVYEAKGKIVAKVYLNMDELSKKYAFFKEAANYHSMEVHHKISQFLTEMRIRLNEHLNKFSQVSKLELVNQPFEKTATHKIKRH